MPETEYGGTREEAIAQAGRELLGECDIDDCQEPAQSVTTFIGPYVLCEAHQNAASSYVPREVLKLARNLYRGRVDA